MRADDFQVRVDVTDRHYSPDDVAHEHQVREADVFLQRIDVLAPAEPMGFNLAEMHFDVTFSATLGDATLAEVGPVRPLPIQELGTAVSTRRTSRSTRWRPLT